MQPRITADDNDVPGDDVALLLTQDDVRPLLYDRAQLDAALEAIERSVLQHDEGSSGAVAWVDLPGQGDGGVKSLYIGAQPLGDTLRLFPAPGTRSGPNANVMLLVDGHSGELLALLAGDDLNALRTSLPAAVGARFLARPGASTLGVLGSGDQARSHARTITRAAPAIERIAVWSPTPANRERYAKEMSEELGLPVDARDGAEAVCREADVLTCTGRTRLGGAFEPGWVRPGALVISMTFSAPPQLFASARCFVPSHARPRVLAMARDFPPNVRLPDTSGWGTLAEVIRGAPARQGDDDVVLYELAAMYSWDAPIMRWAYDWACANGVGTTFSLTAAGAPPSKETPK